jgi:hypothetical protein
MSQFMLAVNFLQDTEYNAVEQSDEHCRMQCPIGHLPNLFAIVTVK